MSRHDAHECTNPECCCDFHPCDDPDCPDCLARGWKPITDATTLESITGLDCIESAFRNALN